ncbi:isopentenyl phosphate kinase family protein [Litorilinea aerophila]|uniref:Isopentenyl phosphate kinase n=1 Tax=Litorilinea aerophila TaxID=1204385 RepID=A0A540VIQ2_9CHLR|nr:isopentenyl phosphate kinase [Litorilinea aerophila]MCC9075881.1 isopentenyl phosphate kinase family protein [Litorilinea aerophila]
MGEMVFVKLGGSLITDKQQPETPRRDVIRRLAQEIAAVRRAHPALQLVLGHGSGSFGHVYGRRYGTRSGVQDAEGWYGFAATADAAARLHRIVVGELLAAGVPAWGIQPGVALRCRDGQIYAGPDEAVQLALGRGLQPVLYGDVALDDLRGGTIASTEEIFLWLARRLSPRRVVLLGQVDGVYSADPHLHPAARPIPTLDAASLSQLQGAFGQSHGVDVTGGMAAKVQQAVELAQAVPGLEVIICSGLPPGHLSRALTEEACTIGTRIV